MGDVNLMHVNIRSVYKNFDHFLVFLESTEKDFDVIVMSETHTVHNICDFNITGYTLFSNNSALNTFDGCLVYVKEQFYQDHCIVCENDVKLIRVTLSKCASLLDIYATYRSHAITKNDFIDNLSIILQRSVHDQNRTHILVGDMNIDLLDSSSIPTNDYLTMLNSYGFSSVINKVTRKTDETATCIDHFFVKCKNHVLHNVNPVVLVSDFTDHYPILLNIRCSEGSSKKQMDKTIHQINYTILSQLIRGAEWGDVLRNNDVNACTNIFVECLQNCINRASKTRKISNKKFRLKAWITGGLLVSIRKRDQLKRQCTLNRNNLEDLNKYKKYRDTLSKLIKQAKYAHYKKLLKDNLNDPKKTWAVIREATNDHASRSEIKSVLDSNAVEISDSDRIANEFNSYFANIGSELAKKIPNCENPVTQTNATPNCFYLTPITENELIKQIKSLKNEVKSGGDGITSEIIKNNHQFLLKPLTHIINLIFCSGVFPDALKNAIIVPVFKQGNKKLTTNYRPIALISTVSKIVEKCIKHKLMLFLEKYNLLSTNQYAFREGCNTENALCRVTDEILQNLDIGRRVIGVFLDLRKAFDTVAHRILLDRLDKMGIRGIANKLLKSYLEGRTQRVKISNTLSDHLQVGFGVPQGTVLGPLLFNIYINQILSLLDDGSVFCFADDTAIIVSGECWNSTIEKAEIAMSKIKKWLDCSLLSLNVEKTKFMSFALSSRSLPNNQNLKLHNSDCNLNKRTCKCSESIERKSSLKYLGILIDENFTWKEHINYVTSKIRKLIFKFYELRNILPLQTLKTVYFALIESVINYGLVVWGNAGRTSMFKLEVAQKWVIKVMLFKNKRYPTELVYKESSLLTLNQLYIKSVIRFMLKMPYYKKNLNHGANTRNAALQNVLLRNPKHTACQKHIYCAGPKIYNSIPTNLKVKPYYRVKNQITKWILDTGFTLVYLE